MRTLFLTAVVATALVACTVETKNNAPTPAADGGVTGSGDSGVKTTKGVKTPTTTKDAGTAAPSTGTTGTTCKDAVTCLSACADGDDACQNACVAKLPDAETQKLVELGDCINNSGCDTDECIADVCATPINVCLGN